MEITKEIKKYMAEIGRKGGSVKSEKKRLACQRNGKMGGRPKGSKNKKKKGRKHGN